LAVFFGAETAIEDPNFHPFGCNFSESLILGFDRIIRVNLRLILISIFSQPIEAACQEKNST
jgi:hypothetical protein